MDLQRPSGLAYIVGIPHKTVCALRRTTLQQMLCGDFCGTNAGERAPCRRFRQMGQRGIIIALLQNLPTQADSFIFRLQFFNCPGLFLPDADLCHSRQPFLPSMQTGDSAPLRHTGKQRHLQLRNCIFFCMTNQL